MKGSGLACVEASIGVKSRYAQNGFRNGSTFGRSANPSIPNQNTSQANK
jgi:hypothetical protein